MSDPLTALLVGSLALNLILGVSVWYLTKYLRRDVENIALSIGLIPTLKKQ